MALRWRLCLRTTTGWSKSLAGAQLSQSATGPPSPICYTSHIHTYLSYDAIRVNDEKPSQRNALLLDQDTIILAQLVVLIGEQRDVNLAETTVSPGGIGPRQQTILAIGRGEDDLCVARLEVGGALGKGDDLGRAHEGPGHGDEAEHEPLLGAGVLGEGEVCGGVLAGLRVGWYGVGGMTASWIDSSGCRTLLVMVGVPSKVPSTTAVPLKAGAGFWTRALGV